MAKGATVAEVAGCAVAVGGIIAGSVPVTAAGVAVTVSAAIYKYNKKGNA